MTYPYMGAIETIGRDEWNRGRAIEVCPDGGDECGFEQGYEYCGRYHGVNLPCPQCLAERWNGGDVAELQETDCGAKLFCPECERVYRDYNEVAEEAALAVKTSSEFLNDAMLELDPALSELKAGCYGKVVASQDVLEKARKANLEARRFAIAVERLCGRAR